MDGDRMDGGMRRRGRGGGGERMRGGYLVRWLCLDFESGV